MLLLILYEPQNRWKIGSVPKEFTTKRVETDSYWLLLLSNTEFCKTYSYHTRSETIITNIIIILLLIVNISPKNFVDSLVKGFVKRNTFNKHVTLSVIIIKVKCLFVYLRVTLVT